MGSAVVAVGVDVANRLDVTGAAGVDVKETNVDALVGTCVVMLSSTPLVARPVPTSCRFGMMPSGIA